MDLPERLAQLASNVSTTTTNEPEDPSVDLDEPSDRETSEKSVVLPSEKEGSR